MPPSPCKRLDHVLLVRPAVHRSRSNVRSLPCGTRGWGTQPVCGGVKWDSHDVRPTPVDGVKLGLHSLHTNIVARCPSLGCESRWPRDTTYSATASIPPPKCSPMLASAAFVLRESSEKERLVKHEVVRKPCLARVWCWKVRVSLSRALRAFQRLVIDVPSQYMHATTVESMGCQLMEHKAQSVTKHKPSMVEHESNSGAYSVPMLVSSVINIHQKVIFPTVERNYKNRQTPIVSASTPPTNPILRWKPIDFRHVCPASTSKTTIALFLNLSRHLEAL